MSLTRLRCTRLPLSTAALLRHAGIDTIHVGEIGIPEAEDAEIIQRAREQKRVVATLDADFHTLLAFDKAISPSVIRIEEGKCKQRGNP